MFQVFVSIINNFICKQLNGFKYCNLMSYPYVEMQSVYSTTAADSPLPINWKVVLLLHSKSKITSCKVHIEKVLNNHLFSSLQDFPDEKWYTNYEEVKKYQSMFLWWKPNNSMLKSQITCLFNELMQSKMKENNYLDWIFKCSLMY